MNMKKTIALTCLFLQSIASADQGSNEALTAMATAKLAGACEAMDALIEFQKTTKLPGGEEFVVRFMNSELAQLGLDMDTYFSVCAQSISTYERIWESIGQASRMD